LENLCEDVRIIFKRTIEKWEDRITTSTGSHSYCKTGLCYRLHVIIFVYECRFNHRIPVSTVKIRQHSHSPCYSYGNTEMQCYCNVILTIRGVVLMIPYWSTGLCVLFLWEGWTYYRLCVIHMEDTECIQKFPDWIDKEIQAYNNKHSLRSTTKGYGGKTV